MNIYYDQQHSMDVFHSNVNVQALVDICLKYYNTSVFDDIIGSITVKNKNSAKNFWMKQKSNMFHQIKQDCS